MATQPIKTQAYEGGGAVYAIPDGPVATIHLNSVDIDFDSGQRDTIITRFSRPCVIKQIYTVLSQAFTGADCVLTCTRRAAGALGTAVETIGTVTIATSGSGAGVEDSLASVATVPFAAGDGLGIAFSGNSDGSAWIDIVLEVIYLDGK